MRVLMTTDCVGGVWTYSLELADALADFDVHVTLAVLGGSLSSEQRDEVRRARVDRCFAADFPLEWQQDWTGVRRSGEWLRGIGEKVRPDVVHVNGYVHAALGWEQPVVVVGHSCVPSWYEAVRGQRAPSEWDRYRLEVARGLAAADLVVAPTRTMLEALRRHHHVPCEAQVIPNGVAAAPSAAAKEPRVLAAGRVWDEAKNVAALVRVADRIGAPVEVAGEGSIPCGVARLLGRLGRTALQRRMESAAVFCAPARYEPFGLAPLEAARMRCGLVLGDIPSLREVWDDAALFVDPDDDEGLVAALRRALDEQEALGARAQEHAERYGAQRMAEAYLDAYERTLTWTSDIPIEAPA